MEPPTEAHTREPQDQRVLGRSVLNEEQFDRAWAESVAELDGMSNSDLFVDSGIEPIVSTLEAAEHFGKTSQWVYWGLRPDPRNGEVRFVHSDGTPIVPERVGNNSLGRRRFTPTILRAILHACYRRGMVTQADLPVIIRRIRYTELGVEWREREGWVYAELGRGRRRWVKPERATFDEDTQAWRVIK